MEVTDKTKKEAREVAGGYKINMIFKIRSANDILEDGGMSPKYLNAIAKAGLKLVKEKDELGYTIYKIHIDGLSNLRLLHKIVNHDLVISFPEFKRTGQDALGIMCDSDASPKIIIYDDWME